MTGLEGKSLGRIDLMGTKGQRAKPEETAEMMVKVTAERSDGLSANPNVLNNC